MTETAEILSRLRCQHMEVAGLAADAIERLVVSEAEARQALAEMQEQCLVLLGQLNPKDMGQLEPRKIAQAG
jgi:hypothetical protein